MLILLSELTWKLRMSNSQDNEELNEADNVARVSSLVANLKVANLLKDVLGVFKEAKFKEETFNLFVSVSEKVLENDHSELTSSSEPISQSVIEIGLEDRELMKKYVVEFKAELRKKVVENGGINWLASELKVSPPSISRFFRTDSMPRLATVKQIYSVLGCSSLKVLI